MNKQQYLAPALAVVIVATWLIYLRTSTSIVNRNNITQEASGSRDNIAREKKPGSSGNSSDALSANGRTKEKQAASSDAPDTSTAESNASRSLKKLILDLYGEGASQDEPAKRAAAMRLRQLLVEMNEDELTAAYQEMNALPLSPKNRWELEDVMLYYLESKNPEFAFSQHIARFEKNDQLTDGIGRFDEWLNRDPAAATAWYEGEVAKGTFDKTLDGKSSLRLPFEAAYVRSLLASDPAAAESKMNAISPEQRKELFATYFKYPQGDPKPLVDLIRKTMPKEEQAELVITQIHVLRDTDKVLERLAIINATQEERSLLLQKLASKYLNSDKLDNALLKQYRDWSLAVDPSSSDRSAGLAFAQYTENRQTPQDYEYLTKLAIEFHGLGAGDDFIIGLVEGSGTSRTPLPLENARTLAMKISDQTRRNQILEKLQ